MPQFQQRALLSTLRKAAAAHEHPEPIMVDLASQGALLERGDAGYHSIQAQRTGECPDGVAKYSIFFPAELKGSH